MDQKIENKNETVNMKNTLAQLGVEAGVAAKNLLIREFDVSASAVKYDFAGALGGYGKAYENENFQRLRTGNELPAVLSALKLTVVDSSRVYLAYEDIYVNDVYEGPLKKIANFVGEKWDDLALGDIVIFDASAKWFVHIDRVGHVYFQIPDPGKDP